MTGILGHRGLLLKPIGGGSGWVTAQSWTPDTNSTGWSGYNIRTRINAAQLVPGSKFRITLNNVGIPINMAACRMQTRNMAGDAYDFSTTPVQVLFAGSASISSAGGTFVSDEINLVQSATSDIVIACYFNSTTTLREKSGVTTGWNYYFRTGVGDDTATVNATGYSGVSRAIMFPLIEIFQP